MSILKTEKGVTLLELLAAIVIVTMIGAVVWGFLFQSKDVSEIEVSKQQLQQEANLILASIQQKHLTNTEYTVSTSATENSTSQSDTLYIDNEPFKHKGIMYELTGSDVSPIKGTNYHLKLTLSSSANPSITYTFETTFSRIMKGDE